MNESIKKRIEAVRQGEVPEGYRRTRAGLMPFDWQVDLAAKDVFRNYTNKKHNGEFQVLSATQDRGIILRSEVDIDIKFAEENVGSYKKVDAGCFVISLRSFQGGIEYSEYEGLVSPAYTVLKATRPISDNYYRAYFKTPDFISRLNGAVYGIRDGKQIGYEDFGELAVHYPPLAEQQKIAEILATCDRVIELKRQLLEEKRRQKQWLMQKLLDPNSDMRQPECSNVKWITCGIKDLGTVITGSTPDKSCDEFWGGDFPWITSQDFTGKYISTAGVHVTEAGKKKCRVLPAGAVLVTCIASIGLNAIAQVDCATNQQINAIICNGICSEEMLYYIVEYNKGTLERLAGKTAVPIISKDQFEKIKVTIPECRSEQEKITKVLSAADSEIQLLQSELEMWKQKKKALMQLLLTGLVRVKA